MIGGDVRQLGQKRRWSSIKSLHKKQTREKVARKKQAHRAGRWEGGASTTHSTAASSRRYDTFCHKYQT